MVLLLAGCGTYEELTYKAMNDEERLCVQEQTIALVAQVPRSLSGNDQDWDDAIRMAHLTALEACCEPRLFERKHGNMQFTGKWRPLK